MAITETADQSEAELRGAVKVFPELSEVVAGIDAADAAAEDIERRIVAGDEDVGLVELEEAEKSSRLARLKARRAVRKAEDAAEVRRVARIEEMRTEVRERFPDLHADVLDAFDGAVRAAADLAGAIGAHNRQLDSVVGELVTLGDLPADLNPLKGGRESASMLYVTGVTVDPIDSAKWLGEVTWRALSAAGDDQAAQFTRLAGVSQDRETAEAYDVPDRPNGAAGITTPSIILRHKVGQLRKGARS